MGLFYEKYVEALEDAVRESWSRETTADPEEWREENPAYCQCAVTALVVQDYLGGEIDWMQVEIGENEGPEEYFDTENRISHFYNIVDGERVDFTYDQFPEGCEDILEPDWKEGKLENYESCREYILQTGFIDSNYKKLREEVDRRMGDKWF